MKRILAIILAVLMFTVCLAENSENAAEPVQLAEGEILMHGYISPYADYYIGVPAEWAIIGAGSTNENMTEASNMLENLNVYGIQKEMTKDNDVLYCISADGKGLILTYGKSEGVTNDKLVERLDEFEASIEAACPGVKFDEDSGAYTYKSVYELLHIGMNYKGRDIDQYYMITGTYLYVFTFFGTTAEIADTVLSTFYIK